MVLVNTSWLQKWPALESYVCGWINSFDLSLQIIVVNFAIICANQSADQSSIIKNIRWILLFDVHWPFHLDPHSFCLQIVRTLCYTTKLVSAIQQSRGNDDLAAKLAIFSSKMSQTRANLRLFDDIPMIQYSMEYGLGEREPDRLMAAIGVMTNVVDHCYYPVIRFPAELFLINRI